MAVVTFLSDYGSEDHYAAAIKGIIIGMSPESSQVDISHHIRPFNISHGAYVLKNAYQHFPKGSIHLIALDSPGRKNDRILIASLHGHLFVSKDTGIFSILDEQPPEFVIEVDSKLIPAGKGESIAKVAGLLAQDKDPKNLGTLIGDELRLIARAPKVSKREIVGTIVRIDHYGNLITNIKQVDYDQIQKINGNVPILIQIGREHFQQFNKNYGEVEPGECYVLFNSDGFVQIGINLGNAKDLLGLKEGASVYITFHI